MAVAAALAWLLFAGRQPRAIAWGDVADRFAGADFVHVSLYLADSRYEAPVPVQLWLGSGGRARLQCFHQTVWARKGRVLAVASADDAYIGGKADQVLPIPRAHPLLNPVLAVIPLQLLAYEIAVRRGTDVDQPRNLAKSVTVE